VDVAADALAEEGVGPQAAEAVGQFALDLGPRPADLAAQEAEQGLDQAARPPTAPVPGRVGVHDLLGQPLAGAAETARLLVAVVRRRPTGAPGGLSHRALRGAPQE
jgi:hypothetical protein